MRVDDALAEPAREAGGGSRTAGARRSAERSDGEPFAATLSSFRRVEAPPRNGEDEGRRPQRTEDDSSAADRGHVAAQAAPGDKRDATAPHQHDVAPRASGARHGTRRTGRARSATRDRAAGTRAAATPESDAAGTPAAAEAGGECAGKGPLQDGSGGELPAGSAPDAAASAPVAAPGGSQAAPDGNEAVKLASVGALPEDSCNATTPAASASSQAATSAGSTSPPAPQAATPPDAAALSKAAKHAAEAKVAASPSSTDEQPTASESDSADPRAESALAAVPGEARPEESAAKAPLPPELARQELPGEGAARAAAKEPAPAPTAAVAAPPLESGAAALHAARPETTSSKVPETAPEAATTPPEVKRELETATHDAATGGGSPSTGDEAAPGFDSSSSNEWSESATPEGSAAPSDAPPVANPSPAQVAFALRTALTTPSAATSIAQRAGTHGEPTTSGGARPPADAGFDTSSAASGARSSAALPNGASASTEGGAPAGARLPEALPAWAERIAEGVRFSSLRDGGQMRVELSPRGLGHIDVQLHLDGDGVRAVIVAQHEETRALIASQQHVLQAALERSDVRLSGFSVDVGSHSAGRDARGDAERAAQHAAELLAAPALSAPEVPAAPPQPSAVPTGRVSVRV